MEKRKINIIGSVDHDLYSAFLEEIEALERSNKPIEIDLCSDGGDAFVAIAFFNRIRQSECEITITAYGLVASAAVLILAAGDNRRMTKDAWVMVHEEEVALEEGVRVKNAEKELKHLRRIETQWNDLLNEATGVPSDVWGKLHEVETYLNAEECKHLNLVMEIV